MELKLEAPRVQAAAQFFRARISSPPRVALVLGSGLGAYADTFSAKTAIPFSELPGMPASKVVGHAGNFVFGKAHGIDVVAMQGRVHLYEGHPVRDVVLGLRALIALGANTVILTNAAGGCGDGLVAGDLMAIDDHLNLTGQNPLIGAHEGELGPRFPDMTTAYDADLRAIAHEVAKTSGFALKQGVYAGLLGPNYETPAEVRYLRNIGAHAVGMSTVLETIAARHMGARVLGISCITNLAAGLGQASLDHSEVTEVAQRVRARFTGLLDGVLAALAGKA